MARSLESVTPTGIFARFVFALLLVYATWNPFGKSFVHWVVVPLFGGSAAGSSGASAPLKFLLAAVLVAGWAIYLQATRRALGMAGTILVAALCAGVVWLLTSWQVISMQGNGILHVVLVCLAILLTVGMSWSHVSRAMTGQTDTDIVE
jgi:hypothetical protein